MRARRERRDRVLLVGPAHHQLVALVAQLDRVAVLELESTDEMYLPSAFSTGTYMPRRLDSQPASSCADGSTGLP